MFFISKSLALTIHQQQIERFGGSCLLRDEASLESALGAAQQTWYYTQDIYQVAAQYCYSLARNHPFVDGNKRVAAACMLVFLLANQKQPLMSNTELYDWVIQIATGQLSREELAAWLMKQCQSITS